jgi:thiol-disulfide isomerase/thioredoxin
VRLHLWPALSLALVVCCSCAGPSDEAAEIAVGPWRAWLDSPGGDLPFGLEISRDGEALRAFVLNDPERIEIPEISREGRRYTFSIPHYDSRIVAGLAADGRTLKGEWSKTAGSGGKSSRLPFHAVAGDAPRFASQGAGSAVPAEAGASVAGRWRVQFEKDEYPAVGELEQAPDGSVTGTFLTAVGDYRYLAGSFENGRLRLSCFDGAHAFLFDARLEPDGSLSGDFWSRDSWHETWTARRDDAAGLVDPFGLTRWTGELSLEDLEYPDLDGNRRSLADPALGGPVRIIEVFGTWCPNCNDAAGYLAELHGRYGERGLAIVGLAFEMTGDFDRDVAQVRTYTALHGIEFPILIGGTHVKADASEAFRAIDRVRSYPTMIFVDADDRVRAVYTGYSGPATGKAHERLRMQFESLIEEMLADAAS